MKSGQVSNAADPFGSGDADALEQAHGESMGSNSADLERGMSYEGGEIAEGDKEETRPAESASPETTRTQPGSENKLTKNEACSQGSGDAKKPDKVDAKKPDKVVFVRINVFDVSNVDVREQFFVARFYYEVCWEGDVQEGQVKNFDYDHKVHLGNIQSLSLESEDKVLDWYYEPEKIFVCHRFVCVGKFSCQELSLRSFPFDVQSFTFEFRSHRTLKELEIKPNPYLASVIQAKKFNMSREYDFSTRIYYLAGYAERKSRVPNSVLKFGIAAYRLPKFIILNVMVPVAVGSGIGLMAFTFKSTGNANEDFEKRSNLLIAVLLTLVAFKFSIVGMIPIVNYLTFLDKYMLGFFLWQIFLMILCVIFAVSKKDQQHYWTIAGWICFGIYMVVCILLGVLFTVKSQVVRKDRKEARNSIVGNRKRDCLDRCFGKCIPSKSIYETGNEKEIWKQGKNICKGYGCTNPEEECRVGEIIQETLLSADEYFERQDDAQAQETKKPSCAWQGDERDMKKKVKEKKGRLKNLDHYKLSASASSGLLPI